MNMDGESIAPENCLSEEKKNAILEDSLCILISVR